MENGSDFGGDFSHRHQPFSSTGDRPTLPTTSSSYSSPTEATRAARSNTGRSFSSSTFDEEGKPWDEQSWYVVKPHDFLAENSAIAESMYLEHNSPEFSLYRGEVVVSKTHALTSQKSILDPYSSQGGISGTLFVTSFRLFFNSFSESNKFSLEVSLSSIASVSEISSDRSDLVHLLEVRCKDFRVIRFGFPYDCTTNPAFNDLRYLRRLVDTPLNKSFAFALHTSVAPHADGWKLYNIEMEFKRQGVRFDHLWRLSNVNRADDHPLCSSYPQLLVVPSAITDKELKNVAAFRSRDRFPVVSYVHCNGVGLCRSSQPLIGLTRSRSHADENMLKAIMVASNAREFCILDCRSYTAAFANAAMGGGFENTTYYESTKVVFLNMENIHVVRDSFKKLFDLSRAVAATGDSMNWLVELESTHWLDHIKSLLSAAKTCATYIENGTPVLCHCSDGWDRTMQVCALAQIILDPYFRTMKGFGVLIEKEFCEFGHRFSSRVGETGLNHFFENDQISPIFLQFLDCTWQLLNMFPCDFEFNGDFLISLMDYLYSGKVGTFLCDSDLERRAGRVRDLTTSVWTHLLSPSKTDDYCNPLYDPPAGAHTLQLKVHFSDIRLWIDYYFRYIDEDAGRGRREMERGVRRLRCERDEVRDRLERMEERCRKTAIKFLKQKEANERLEKEVAVLKRRMARGSRNIVIEETEDTVFLSVGRGGSESSSCSDDHKGPS